MPVTNFVRADAFDSFEQVMCSSVHGMAHQTHGNRNRHRENSAGFTLFELVIVMLIVAVMAAIAIPSFRYVTTSNRIASEVNQLLGDMRFARTEAIKEGQTVTVCSSANPHGVDPHVLHGQFLANRMDRVLRSEQSQGRYRQAVRHCVSSRR